MIQQLIDDPNGGAMHEVWWFEDNLGHANVGVLKENILLLQEYKKLVQKETVEKVLDLLTYYLTPSFNQACELILEYDSKFEDKIKEIYEIKEKNNE